MSLPPISYEPDFSDPIQVVRHLIGDVDVTEPMLSDAEIAYDLGAAAGDTTVAAVNCCRRLQARYAAMADTEDGELSVKASQLYDHYKDLAATLANPLSAGGSGGAVPYAGGISVADGRARDANTDRVPTLFARNRPGASWQPYDLRRWW